MAFPSLPAMTVRGFAFLDLLAVTVTAVPGVVVTVMVRGAVGSAVSFALSSWAITTPA